MEMAALSTRTEQDLPLRYIVAFRYTFLTFVTATRRQEQRLWCYNRATP
jgi:hypothetical protein